MFIQVSFTDQKLEDIPGMSISLSRYTLYVSSGMLWNTVQRIPDVKFRIKGMI